MSKRSKEERKDKQVEKNVRGSYKKMSKATG